MNNSTKRRIKAVLRLKRRKVPDYLLLIYLDASLPVSRIQVELLCVEVEDSLTQKAGDLLSRFGHVHLQDKVCMGAEAKQCALLTPKLHQLFQNG